MENSQVTWKNSVPYDELVKQCPYLAHHSGFQIDPPQSEDINVTGLSISKSKKKRLKKRLKALCTASNPVPLDTSKADNLQQVVSFSKENILKNFEGAHSSISKNIHSHKSSNFSKNHSPNAQSDLNDSKVLKCADSATKKLTISDKLKVEVMSSKSATPQKEGTASKSPMKARVPDTVDGEILMPSSNVNRAQVSTEREARKKAKQQTKSQKNSGEVIVKSFMGSDKVNNTDLKDSQSEKIAQKLVIESGTKSSVDRKNRENKIAILSSKPNDDRINEPPKCLNITSSKMPSVSEKSREEIKAEREAKKKAKQLAKQKKSDKPEEPFKYMEEVPVSINDHIDSQAPAPNKDKPSPFENVEGVAGTVPTKSKAEIRAERRAKQDAQRAAKEAEKKSKSDVKESNKKNIIPEKSKSLLSEKVSDSFSLKDKVAVKTKVVPQQRIKLFSHLHPVPKPSQTQIIQNIHPSVIELGVKYSSRIINGSNSRCVALLNCLKKVIKDYATPAEKEFSRGLESKLGELTNYLNQCRPMAVSMTNALRHIKSHLTQLPNNVSDDEAKRKLLDVIDTFIREQIDVAGDAICDTVTKKIANDDVILIYSCSSLLYRILVESHRGGREFSVVVVDGGPWFEGREMLRRLVDAGLNCTYVQVSAVSFIMRQATKVLLGAHALLANGCVMSRAGASLIALVAHSCNVPVLVCCETYKFCERVQTDAFVYNELGNPEDLLKGDERLAGWQSLGYLSPLSLLYDITPPDLVTAVVTELAILPCTSVPVILRVKPSDLIL